MENDQRVTERLDNIRSVEPILNALRMISLGSWQAALKRRQAAAAYSSQLVTLLSDLRLPSIKTRRRQPKTKQLVLVVGSERGLCGRFNRAVSEHAQTHLPTTSAAEVHLLGKRLAKLWKGEKRPFSNSHPMPFTSLPNQQLAHTFATEWLIRYEAYTLDRVIVIHNRYDGAGRYTPQTTQLLPPKLPSLAATTSWPPPIIETDPQTLVTQLLHLWLSSRLLALLLDSAAAEHAARYQLTESATQNAKQLIAELTATLQTARQQAITREMQELAVTTGLVDDSS